MTGFIFPSRMFSSLFGYLVSSALQNVSLNKCLFIQQMPTTCQKLYIHCLIWFSWHYRTYMNPRFINGDTRTLIGFKKLGHDLTINQICWLQRLPHNQGSYVGCLGAGKALWKWWQMRSYFKIRDGSFQSNEWGKALSIKILRENK